jgi:hypothetical protein
MALGAGGCAHATRPVVLERPAGAAVSRLSDLPPMPGANVVVLLRGGESARGAVETIDGSVLVLRVNEDAFITRRVAEEEIVCLARRVGKSTTARGWLGALIGAAASLPFGISMTGDMMMPAAIAGALIGGNTGQPRARVLLDRSHLVAGESACPGSLEHRLPQRSTQLSDSRSIHRGFAQRERRRQFFSAIATRSPSYPKAPNHHAR